LFSPVKNPDAVPIGVVEIVQPPAKPAKTDRQALLLHLR